MDWDVIEVPSGISTIHAKNVHLIVEPKTDTAGERSVEYEDLNIVTQHFDGKAIPETNRYTVEYNYIIGNPPFVGARWMSKSKGR